MKLFKTLLFSAISVCGIFGFSSCNDDSTPGVPLYGVDLENAQISFNSDNYWTGCYDVAIGDFKADGLTSLRKRPEAHSEAGLRLPSAGPLLYRP